MFRWAAGSRPDISLIRRWFKKNLVLILILLFFSVCGADYFHYREKIYPGIYVKDIYLGNKTVLEAEALLDGLLMTFYGPNAERSFKLQALGVELLREEIISRSYARGRERLWPFNYPERLRLKEGYHVPLSYKLNREELAKGIGKLKDIFEQDPQDACFEAGNAGVTPEKSGYRLREKELAAEIMKVLDQKDTPPAVTVPVDELPPLLTLEQLAEKGITAGLASFSTLFDASNKNRAHNIALAAAQLHQMLIPPGHIFSFNRVIGDTTPEKGYREALIIQDGVYVTGYGGGVCQVSSTLYNAVLLANLKVLERHHHRYESDYVPAGRDATVAYGGYDFIFLNNRDHHIILSSKVEEGKITIGIAGTDLGEKVEIFTRQTSFVEPYLRLEETSLLAPGEEETVPGKPGGRVEVWRRVTCRDGRKTEEMLFVDSYQPYPAIIRRGKAGGG